MCRTPPCLGHPLDALASFSPRPVPHHELACASRTVAESRRLPLRHALPGRSRFRSAVRALLRAVCLGLLLFGANSAQGQVAVEVEPVPERPGPYYAGQHITVDVWLHSQLPDDYILSLIQFDFADTDPSLILDAQFAFDFSSVPDQPTAYEGWTFPDLPVPWTTNTVGCFCPGLFILLTALGSRHIGSIGVTIPPVGETGSFTLDLLNRKSPSPTIGSNGAILRSGNACETCPPGGQWTAFEGHLSGGSITLTSIGQIPAVSAWGIVVLALALLSGGTLALGRRRSRARAP